jgi:hypothetical protein
MVERMAREMRMVRFVSRLLLEDGVRVEEENGVPDSSTLEALSLIIGVDAMGDSGKAMRTREEPWEIYLSIIMMCAAPNSALDLLGH